MKRDYICPECGVVFNWHANKIPYSMREHYRAEHPAKLADFYKEAEELKKQRKALKVKWPLLTGIFE